MIYNYVLKYIYLFLNHLAANSTREFVYKGRNIDIKI